MEMNENVYRVPILAFAIVVLILLTNILPQKQATDINIEEYNAVEINGETFYEKEEDSNYAIDSVATKDNSTLKNPRVILILRNDNGNADTLDLGETKTYEQIQGVSVEKSYVRKVTSNPASATESSTKYFLYLTPEDDKKLTKIVEEQYLGNAGYDVVNLN